MTHILKTLTSSSQCSLLPSLW